MDDPAANRVETLDLAISDMDTHLLEEHAAGLIKGLKGVKNITLIERGASIRYNAGTITKEQIMGTLRAAGFKVTLFQDSKSGQTGDVKF